LCLSQIIGTDTAVNTSANKTLPNSSQWPGFALHATKAERRNRAIQILKRIRIVCFIFFICYSVLLYGFKDNYFFFKFTIFAVVLKAFRYKLLPNKEQATLINKHIGSVRFVYNLALETKQVAYAGNRVNLSCFDLIKQLPDLKEECMWLKEINSQSLQQPIRNLDNAFTRFFKGQGGFPRFKKRSNGGSFNIPQSIIIVGGNLVIPKFKEGIDIVLHRPIKGAIKQATISRTPTGKYFVSILCDTGDTNRKNKPIKEKTTIGVDLGIKSYIVTSDGEAFDNPRFLRKAQNTLRFVQRKYSKNKGKRTRHRLAVLHERVLNQRKDFLHKISAHLIKNHDSIAIENLQVSNMLKNHNLAGAIADCGWSMFVEMLEYKAAWYGKNILRIGTFDPSSKTCSACGSINKELTLQDREWTCGKCETLLDRDVNAAINIKNFALKNHLSVGRRLKNRNELPTLVGVLTSEADSHLRKR
jgi:putative transposase